MACARKPQTMGKWIQMVAWGQGTLISSLSFNLGRLLSQGEVQRQEMGGRRRGSVCCGGGNGR